MAAIDALEAEPELICHWYPDEESILHGVVLLDQLIKDLEGATVVITHAYEHGHPDHDTAALCVRLACDRLQKAGRSAPGVFEFLIYALQDGEPVFGRFMPDPSAFEVVMPVTEEG